MDVRRLPPDLASQIAAGEVVERPASAVKELVENALDADAGRVDVTVAGGGIASLRIRDDGCGMTEANAMLALERHATSKLRDLEHLAHVISYGFRGEALPSIASVSRFRIATRTRDEEAGVELTVTGGAPPSVQPIGIAPGTEVEVRDLFFNVPARRKFLRSSATESGHITDVVENAALAQPGVTFTLTRDTRKVREYLRAASREQRVRAAFGDEVLARCAGTRGPLQVEAFLSRPERARAGAGGIKLLVNNRPIRDRALLLTIAQAYGSVLERGRYPRGVVYIDMPPELVDINVHPQKSELRFADPRAATDAVYRLLSLELAGAFSLPAPSRNPWQAQREAQRPTYAAPQSTTRTTEVADAGAPNWQRELNTQTEATTTVVPSTANPVDTQSAPNLFEQPIQQAQPENESRLKPSAGSRWTDLRFVAQLRRTYLVCEGGEGIYILDQHAAAERVNFDRLRKQFGSRAVPAQALLFPLTLDVSPEEAELIEQQRDDFAGLGINVERRGPETISVHTVPKLLQRASPERLVRDLLSEVSKSGGRRFSDAVDLALATMACHGSIRAGDPITSEEAQALLGALDSADFAGHCPHGRPVVTFTPWTELERKVGRR